MSIPSLSIVIPCYNEEQRISRCLEALTEYFNMDETEIIVVVDGSTDSTLTKVNSFKTKFSSINLLDGNINFGKGASVKRGMLAARGDFIFFMDVDLSASLDLTFQMRAKLEDEYDVVIASRAHPEAVIEVRQSWIRNRMGKIFNMILRSVISLKWKDTQCGCKGFTKEAVKKIFPFLETCGFAFDVELLMLAEKEKLRIAEIPAIWKNDDESKVSIIKDSLAMLNEIFSISKRFKKK